MHHSFVYSLYEGNAIFRNVGNQSPITASPPATPLTEPKISQVNSLCDFTLSQPDGEDRSLLGCTSVLSGNADNKIITSHPRRPRSAVRSYLTENTTPFYHRTHSFSKVQVNNRVNYEAHTWRENSQLQCAASFLRSWQFLGFSRNLLQFREAESSSPWVSARH